MSEPRNAAHRVSIKCIFVCNNKVLLLHFINSHRTLVGGGVDEGEDIITAMKREFTEETWNVWNNNFQPELLHIDIEQYPERIHFSAVANIYYKIKVNEEFSVIPEPGVYVEYRRCTKEDIISLPGKFNKDIVLTSI